MAPPRAGAPRRQQQQPNEHIYTLGERGRKTGVFLRDTGVRDEHGMEPIDDIFSSPAKSQDGDASDAEVEEEAEEEEEDDNDDDHEVDMDLTTASGPDPAALLNGQRSAARGGTRQGRSPGKPLFGSPAVRRIGGGGASTAEGGSNGAALRQNQRLQPPSPGDAGANDSSPMKPVKRWLDFGKSVSANTQRKPVLLPGGASKRNHGDDEDENILHGSYHGGADDSMQVVDADDRRDEEEADEDTPEDASAEEEEEEEVEPIQPKRRGRPRLPGSKNGAKEAANGTKRRRPGRSSGGSDAPLEEEAEEAEQEEQEESEAPSNAKRQRVEAESQPKARGRPPAKRAQEAEGGPQAKGKAVAKGPAAAAAAAAAVAGANKRGRPRKSSGVGAATAMAAAVPRGPPLPKSRGLVIRRREQVGDESAEMRQTRSGRTSYRPLAFWRNEHAEFDTDEVLDGKDRRIVLPAIREIYRVEEDDLPPLATTARAGRGQGRRAAKKGSSGRKRRGDGLGPDEDDEGPERQAWEYEPGRVTGPVAVWYPEFELQPPGPEQELEQEESELALSAMAMETQDVRDGSFRFVKTLSLPFFGTGMVDLAPGAEKRPKNSRKMHMAFFVHFGQVSVTVNETVFRISKGGMWSVPRGNYYSILNDTDVPARIFFSQGCEVLTVVDGEEEE